MKSFCGSSYPSLISTTLIALYSYTIIKEDDKTYPVLGDLTQLFKSTDAFDALFDHPLILLSFDGFDHLLRVLHGGHPLGHPSIQAIALGSLLLH